VALIDVVRETVIPCSPDAVWALVSDLESHPRLGGSGEVQTLRVVDEGPLRAGTRVVATEVVHVGPKSYDLTVRSQVVGLEPGRRLVWQTESPEEFGKPTVRLIEWSFAVQPVPQGTLLTHTLRIEMTSAWVTPLFKPVYALIRGNKVKRGMSVTLRRIGDELVKTGAPAPLS
jgi:uncharacterized protein YndB with AHSA1/START domain